MEIIEFTAPPQHTHKRGTNFFGTPFSLSKSPMSFSKGDFIKCFSLESFKYSLNSLINYSGNLPRSYQKSNPADLSNNSKIERLLYEGGDRVMVPWYQRDAT